MKKKKGKLYWEMIWSKLYQRFLVKIGSGLNPASLVKVLMSKINAHDPFPPQVNAVIFFENSILMLGLVSMERHLFKVFRLIRFLCISELLVIHYVRQVLQLQRISLVCTWQSLFVYTIGTDNSFPGFAFPGFSVIYLKC